MASTDALPVPRKNVAYRVVFAIYDNTGSLVTGAAGLDSEVSKDQGTFSDCTNEATEIATSSGIYYLDLTSTEMNADNSTIIVKTSTTNAKTTVIVLYPQESGDIKVDLQSILGTAVSTPATAGILDVNVKNMNNVAGTSITAINANQGTTQPINFTGTAGSALAKSDMVDVAGAAVSASTAQLGVNVVNFGGSAGTFASGRPEIDLNSSATSELAAVPASTATLKAMLQWVFMLSRNKLLQTATTSTVKANDGTTTVASSTVSDDATTATRGVWS